MVTKDVNMRVRGDALGLQTADFEPERISIDELYPGNRELLVPSGVIDEFYANGSVVVDAPGLHANEFLTLKDEGGKSALTALGQGPRQGGAGQQAARGRVGHQAAQPRAALRARPLLNDDIKLVTLVGKAGTGKTLLAIAAGLQKVTEEQVFSKLLVSRPIFPLGRDIGYLPGDIEEKLNPWMQPIYDNLELLLGLNKTDKKDGRSYAELVDLGFVEIEPLTYIRGRSLPNVYMIVDEAQNLTPHEVKTIITRAGEGTKIILTGDPYQIDHPYLDSSNNGLTTVAERFKNEAIAGHVILTKGERSPLAGARDPDPVNRIVVLAALGLCLSAARRRSGNRAGRSASRSASSSRRLRPVRSRSRNRGRSGSDDLQGRCSDRRSGPSAGDHDPQASPRPWRGRRSRGRRAAVCCAVKANDPGDHTVNIRVRFSGCVVAGVPAGRRATHRGHRGHGTAVDAAAPPSLTLSST
jgi:PhoH-like ATPase